MNWRKSLISLLVIVVLFVLTYLLYGMLAGMAELPEEKQKEAIKLYVKTEKVSYTTNKAKITET
ncbi:MAG: hypothetical protein K8S16_16375, partial [Bacteroidales bacterium]|nr:hypothetical protein [Bacteroidales bacterium]